MIKGWGNGEISRRPHLRSSSFCLAAIAPEALSVKRAVLLRALAGTEGSAMIDSMTTESRSEARVLNFERLRIAKLQTEPFDYILASGIIRADWTDRLISDYPPIRKAGSFPLSALRCGADFPGSYMLLMEENFVKSWRRNSRFSWEDARPCLWCGGTVG